MRKPTFCICENKDADQLRGYREADQRLCFRYTDSTIPLLPKSEISNLWPSSVAIQPGLCHLGDTCIGISSPNLKHCISLYVLLEMHMNGVLRKPTFCICENKDVDQLRGNPEADQRLCFRYTDSTTIPLLSNSEISSLWPSSVAIQPGLCQTRSETRTLVFS